VTDFRGHYAGVFSQTNDEIICHYGYDPSPDPADRVTGMSDDLLEVMMRHHARIKSLKWQYYGNEHGTLYTYPAVGTCAVTNYDPRVRYAASNIFYRAMHFTAMRCIAIVILYVRL